jgi:aminoglycoside phosphotransferase (APT) family kinase protein
LLPDAALLKFLEAAGLARPGERPAMQPLAGGVSSDIWRVDLHQGPVCVKRALPKLRVAQNWEAPVARNRYEYEWFRVAGEAAPGVVPRVLAHGNDSFAMEYLDPASYPVWKELLRQGRADRAFAAAVGRALGAIHRSTAGRHDIAARFPTDEIFHAIRLEPYLVATGRKHPDLEPQLTALVQVTADTRACLVHGDVSPKNILAGPAGPVFLDAECAWFGDPAFDLAFCLNHLLLKCLWVAHTAPGYLACFDALVDSYGPEDPVEARAAALLPALLLARVDGKSPVEYVTRESQKAHVREFARPRIAQPTSLQEIAAAWQRSLT